MARRARGFGVSAGPGRGERARDEVVVAGRAVRVLREGHGRPIVLVHGLGLGAGFWRYHLARLPGAGYEAIAPDLPGFGRSRGPTVGYSVSSAADWLADFAAVLRIEHALWVGHSVSCQYVLRLAAARPDLVDALVLAAPTGEPGPGRWLAQLIGLARTSTRESGRLVRSVLAHYGTTPPNRTFGTWLGARRHDALADVRRVHCPLLVVLGERDPVVPRTWAERVVAEASGGRLVMIPGSAHGVALDPPEPFCRALLDFAATSYPPIAVEKPSPFRGNDVETR